MLLFRLHAVKRWPLARLIGIVPQVAAAAKNCVTLMCDEAPVGHNRDVLVSEFDYHLPPELIAQQPLADRAASQLLHLGRGRELLEDLTFRNFPDLLRPDDLLVFNNTRVLPARLFGHRSGARAQRVSTQNPAARDFLRGRVEVLLTKQLSAEPMEWEALVHPGRKLVIGERIYFGAG